MLKELDQFMVVYYKKSFSCPALNLNYVSK